jgi:dUTP pyrophosphatase
MRSGTLAHHRTRRRRDVPTEPTEPGAVDLPFVLLRTAATAPKRQSAQASGFDLRACLPEGPVTVGAAPVQIPTGIAIAAPAGTDVQVRPRSGLWTQGVIGMPGTIDADYRGEIFVTLYCLPEKGSFLVQDGDRIAQLVVSRLAPVSWQRVETLEGTDRGADGHGSTGLR